MLLKDRKTGLEKKLRPWTGYYPILAAAEWAPSGAKGQPYTSVVKLLLEAGADPNININTRFGCTPLHYTATEFNIEMAELLLNAGADPNTKDTRGRTPLLDILVWGTVPRRMGSRLSRATEMVEVLLKAGANPCTPDNDGDSALYLAKLKGHTQIVKLFEEHLALQQVSPNLKLLARKGAIHLCGHLCSKHELE